MIQNTASCEFRGELETVYKFIAFLWTNDTVIPTDANPSGRGSISEQIAYDFMVRHPELSILTMWNYPYEFAVDHMPEPHLIIKTVFSFCPTSSGVRVNCEFNKIPTHPIASATFFFQKLTSSESRREREIRNELLRYKGIFEQMFTPGNREFAGLMVDFRRFCLQFDN